MVHGRGRIGEPDRGERCEEHEARGAERVGRGRAAVERQPDNADRERGGGAGAPSHQGGCERIGDPGSEAAEVVHGFPFGSSNANLSLLTYWSLKLQS